MFLLELEQFEIAPFLAFDIHILFLPKTIIIYGVCTLSICTYLFLQPFWGFKPKSKPRLISDKVDESVTLSSGVSYINLHSRDGKKVSNILVPVTIMNQKTSDDSLKSLSSAYINHPWFVEGKFHVITANAHFIPNHKLILKTSDLMKLRKAQTLVGSLIYPPFWNKIEVENFLKIGLDAFIKKHHGEPYKIFIVNIILIES